MKILLVLMLLTLMGCQSKNYDLAYVTDRDNTLDWTCNKKLDFKLSDYAASF